MLNRLNRLITKLKEAIEVVEEKAIAAVKNTKAFKVIQLGCATTSVFNAPGVLGNFVAENRGQGAVDTAIYVVILLAAIMIGGLIFVQIGSLVQTQVNATGNAQAIANLNQVNATGWSAFTMLGIAAFVAAAIVILAQLMGLMGRGQNGGKL